MAKKKQNFDSIDSLKNVERVINEASEAIKDSSRTILTSAIPDVLGGVLGAGAGAGIGFVALYGLGTVGLSAAGITSGLAAAGSVIGMGMVGGIAVLAAPAVVLSGIGICVVKSIKDKQLRQEKSRLYNEAIKKQAAIIKELQKEAQASNERADYLQSLNILLQRAIKDLKADLAA